MSEFEEATEAAKEVVLEEVEHLVDGKAPWVAWLAISTMVMALLSAVGALMAGITSNEAIMERTHEIMELVDRDRDQIEIGILRSKHDVLKALGEIPDEDERALIEKADDVRRLTEEIQEEEQIVARTLRAHELFAIGVTLLSLAITLSGLAVVLQRRRVWHIGLVLGSVGAAVVIYTGIQTIGA